MPDRSEPEIAGYLSNDNYDYQDQSLLYLIPDDEMLKNCLGLPIRPFLGVYQAKCCSVFFPEIQQKPASVVIAPLMRRGRCLGSLNLGSFEPRRFTHSMATDFIQHIATVIGICLENAINFETLRLNILIDPLTGVNNRRFLEIRLEEELVRSQRGRHPLSCLFLDIDLFKSINDTFGHQAGDLVLAQVAAAIKKQLRGNDILARYGGEEFVALLYQSDERSTLDVAERIRATIAGLKIEFMDAWAPVTISIGAATYHPNQAAGLQIAEAAVALVKTADAALYKAKRNGRNRVENGGLLAGR